MTLWQPKSIQQLVLISFFVALAPLCVAIFFTVQTLGDLATSNQLVTQRVLALTRLGHEVQRDVLELERRALQYRALADPELAQLFERERDSLADKLQRLDAMIQQPGEALNHLQVSIDALSVRNTGVSGAGGGSTPFIVINAEERDVQHWLQQGVDRTLQRNTEEAESVLEALALQVTLLALATPGMLLLFAYWINRPVRQLTQEIHQLGTAGLSHRIDISGPQEVRVLGVKLEWLRQRLNETDQQKQQFFRHISHELKTPLASLREGTDLLAEQVTGRLSQQQLQIVDIVRSNGLELQHLIENLLDYNQLPQRALRYEEIALQELWQELLANYRITADRKSLRLRLHGTVNSWVADQGTLKTALDNLLSNAINYTPEGGLVDIGWSAEPAGLLIEVANSGEPIPEADVERVFEPFIQSAARRTGPIKGSGIGLTVARECMTAQGGSLTLAEHATLPVCFRLICPSH